MNFIIKTTMDKDAIEVGSISVEVDPDWLLYFDESSTGQRSAASIVLVSLDHI